MLEAPWGGRLASLEVFDDVNDTTRDLMELYCPYTWPRGVRDRRTLVHVLNQVSVFPSSAIFIVCLEGEN